MVGGSVEGGGGGVVGAVCVRERESLSIVRVCV